MPCVTFSNTTPTQKGASRTIWTTLALSILCCNYLISQFLQLCEELNIPVSLEKTDWAQDLVTFLGILLDGRNFTLGIPLDKHNRAVHMLQTMIDRKKATVKDLQQLCGFLNFISKAIFPGRTFIRRMYAKFAPLMGQSLNGLKEKVKRKLKPFHHVRLDNEFKSDCKIWLEFLQGDLSQVVSRPMVDILGKITTMSTDIDFYSDASASDKLGFRCLLNSKWIQGFRELKFIEQKPSIEFLELFALTAGILTWQNHEELTNCRVVVFCDNTAVMQMINDMSSSCKHCMVLLRKLVLNRLKCNRRLAAKYVSMKANYLADSLSRGQWKRFRTLRPHMNQFLDEISEEIWPVNKVWNV